MKRSYNMTPFNGPNRGLLVAEVDKGTQQVMQSWAAVAAFGHQG